MFVYISTQSLSHVWLFGTPWTIARQAPCPWDFPGKNTGVACHCLLQGIFSAQGSNLCLLQWQADSSLSHLGNLAKMFKLRKKMVESIDIYWKLKFFTSTSHLRRYCWKRKAPRPSWTTSKQGSVPKEKGYVREKKRTRLQIQRAGYNEVSRSSCDKQVGIKTVTHEWVSSGMPSSIQRLPREVQG